MDNLEPLIDKLRRMATNQVPTAPLISAAQRTAVVTNAQLRSAGVPAQVVVNATQRGVRLTMAQTGPITRRFSTPPMVILRRNLVSELPAARRALADYVRGLLR